MNLKSPTTALLLCALSSACSTAVHSEGHVCIQEAEMTELNGAKTSSEVYNECVSAQIKKDAKGDTFFDEVGVFFIDLLVLIAD
ncbi:hypothetical protein A2I98_03820 [Pseudoalteromonas agarivorans]|uniref:Lipoprotein n=1 Tax=Pseudoalteromonas agarivorans TaxID=176102 RepID=A0ABR5VMM5_9GAMM|nr:hypothetical protein [Pseudoalteromonas telluritireducens]KYL31255.1 hypothetical protein A2I98_03820 [Pseudoalteromonas telluritireducens]